MSVVIIRSALLVLSIAVSAAFWLFIPPNRGWFYQLIGLVTWVALGLEIFGLVTMIKGTVNVAAYNGFVVFEFLVLHLMIFHHRPTWLVSLIVSAVLGSIVSIGYAVYKDPTSFFLTESIVILSVILSGLSFVALWFLAQESDGPLTKEPKFWIFLGFLVYFGGITPVICMLEYLYKDNKELSSKLYGIIHVVAILRYVFTSIAFNIQRKTSQLAKS